MAPSGKLVIESNDALTLRADKPTDNRAEVAVPAGDYLATPYHIDHDALEADELEWSGPSEFIVLTPRKAAKPVAGQPAILPWEPRGPGEAKWVVEPGSYRGAELVHDADTTISVALDPAGVERFGFTDLALARLLVAALDIECVLVYVAGDAEDFEFHARLEKVKPPREHAGGEWAHGWQQPRMDRLFGMRQNARGRVAKKQQETWHPATMTLLKERALEKMKK